MSASIPVKAGGVAGRDRTQLQDSEDWHEVKSALLRSSKTQSAKMLPGAEQGKLSKTENILDEMGNKRTHHHEGKNGATKNKRKLRQD